MIAFLVFILTLSILVLVHELGHFLVARKAGIKVEEFGFGYPPRAWAKKIGETLYSVNWIPFGGFVKLYGEELAEATEKKSKRAFWAKSRKARTMVIVAGVLGNFLLAIVCFSFVYSIVGIPTPTNQVKIVGVAQDSPAEKAALKEEDIILAVDDQPLRDLKHFIALIEEKKETPVKLLIKREKDGNLVLFLTPRAEPPENEGPLGVIVSNMEMKKYPFWQMPFWGAVEGTKEAVGWGSLVFTSLAKMLVDLIGQGVVPKDIAGPVGILQVTADVSQQGILVVLQFVGVLSVNLAVLNILPFPALDGGRLVFVIYEVVVRKRPKPSIEHWVNAAGMAILLFLVILVTINDIRRIFETTQILYKLRALWLK